jgi:NAD(P)-dependent dehydrogenase (short-subunit alcohol dehydrogenase family)
LINNAGLLVNKSFSKQNEEDIDRQLDINFKAPFMLTQLLLPFFNKGAHILNISSMGGVQGSSKFSGLSAYSASKGALAVLTEVMAEELKDQNIKANCLALGATQTEMLAEAFPGYEAPISAAEMGKYVADFAINGHKFYNGKILPVALSTP